MADQPATGASQAPLGTEGNPTHVVSRPAPTIGWAGVQSGVEEFDKEEIQGYKEDMDALLVFIGLFSAVLASFVAMSFSLLQASPAESMVFIMTGMSIQAASYTIQGEFMNSTAPAPTSLPSFEPTHNAIVVNILWTASLIVSLATASGALLVKQWLRQYTNQTTAFAMQKMRIRHFRRIALEDWGVIEIAYALPFLLLMSLPLFFVGLCYFTADIHSSVKNTTFSLVSAWAFFFIAATILPTFSARCPYKTPALSSLTSAMRVYLRPFWIKVLRILVATCADRDERSSFLRSILTTVRVWIATALANITYEGCLRLLGNVRLLRTRTSRILSTTGAHLREWLHHISAIRTMIHGWADRTLASMTNEEHLHDEATAIKTNAGDLAILVDADKLHGNDEVADAALSHAVRQSNLDWEEVLELAKSLILHRLPSQDMFSGTPEFVGLGDMTPRALAAVHNVLDYVESCQPLPWAELFPIPFLRSVCDHTEPECWAFFLRLSASFVQPPTTLPRWLDRCTEDDCDMLGTICQPSNSATVLRSLLALLCRRLEQPDFDLSTSVSRLQSFLWVYFERLDVPDSFEAEQPTPWSDILNNASLGPTVLWLTQQLKSDFATSTTGSSNVRSRETAWGHAVSLIVKFMVVLNDTSDFFDIRGVALKSSETLRSFWISCFKYQLHVSELLVPGHGIDAQGA
ncbi:hypothetical protein BDW22DRAFT_852924 [Trametopsis cervina]|nr:hypothetical protein BDW22DRAFT_852924 [Trametopsis cervina]